jgi:MoaA/NifB/PqqE/SkfB family radical SAM enzyme
MSSRGRQKPTLRGLSRELLRPEDTEAYQAELLESSDRAAALVGASGVEHALRIAILANFTSLDNKRENELFWNPTSPLQSFSSKIHIAYALGVYDDYFFELVASVKEVRNVFAHAIKPISFEHPLVKKVCDKLPEGEKNLKAARTESLSIGRRRYVAVCIQLVSILEDYAHKRREHGVRVRPYLIKKTDNISRKTDPTQDP